MHVSLLWQIYDTYIITELIIDRYLPHNLYTVYRKILASVLFSPLTSLLRAGEFETG